MKLYRSNAEHNKIYWSKFEWEIQRYVDFINNFPNFWPSLPNLIQIFCSVQTFPLNFLCHLQSFIEIGTFLLNSLTNTCCTVLFNCVQKYSNKKNIFSFPEDNISKISVKISDHLNENWSNHQIMYLFDFFWNILNDLNFSKTFFMCAWVSNNLAKLKSNNKYVYIYIKIYCLKVQYLQCVW